MEYTGLRDRKRTPEYPKGQEICLDDIVQFPILLREKDGVTKEVIVRDVVGFNYGQFMLSELTDCDPLAMHADGCEVIGTIHENPELFSKPLSRRIS